MTRIRPGHLVLALLASLFGGCAALTNPTTDGIPVRKLPPELLAPPRAIEQTIPLNTLEQPPSDVYRVAPGDLLGVYVDGVLGEKTQQLPVQVSTLPQRRDERMPEGSLGYPVRIQGDGTISLPFLSPLKVTGLTLQEVGTEIRKAYLATKPARIREDVDRVLLTLVQPRTAKVLVFRQEASSFTIGSTGIETGSKRGTGQLVELRANENDVLHALAQSGGLPGLDAYNQILIYRGCFADNQTASVVEGQLQIGAPLAAAPIVRIPLRMPPGAPLPFHPEDVVLQTGDVVFIEARDQEVFYTAGLLPPGSYILPRDYDLDVLRAIAQVRGPLLNGAFGGSNLSGALLADGIGSPSPAMLVVLRRTPSGGQVPITVDLQKALQDPRERLTVQPGDLLVLQERPEDALARYFSQTFFNFGVIWQPFRSSTATGLVDVAGFNRLQNGAPNVTITPR
jgi:protein involved in polysaccharide export with SLBB domain